MHTAPSAMRVLTDFVRLAPPSYREFGLSWRTPTADEDRMQETDSKPGGLQISLVRPSLVLPSKVKAALNHKLLHLFLCFVAIVCLLAW